MESMTTIRAAERIGCSEDTVRRLINDGDLDAYRIRGSIRIFAQSVDEYLAEQKSIPATDLQMQEQVAAERRERISKRQHSRAPDQLTLQLEAT